MIRFFNWMSQEGLVDFNSDNRCSCPSSYGYALDLQKDPNEKADLKDCWVWPESQSLDGVAGRIR